MINSVVETVSIIMPAYNAEKTISASIDSVIAQTYKDWHLYVIDDASIDDTVKKICDKECCDSRISYISLSNNVGVAEARNAGLKAARGRYIAFLDSDDFWCANKLEIQMDIFGKGFSIVSSNYSIFHENPNHIVSTRCFPNIIKYTDMLKSNKIGNLTAVYDRGVLGTILQKSAGHEDYIMWLELMKKAKIAYCIQLPLAKYRISEKSLSSNKFKAASWQWRVYRKYLGFGLNLSLYYMFFYAFSSIVSRIFIEKQ